MESPGAAPAGCSPASAIPQQINNFFTFIKTLSEFFIIQSEFDIRAIIYHYAGKKPSIQPYRGCGVGNPRLQPWDCGYSYIRLHRCRALYLCAASMRLICFCSTHPTAEAAGYLSEASMRLILNSPLYISISNSLYLISYC